MQRVSGLGGGAARSRPPVLGAGLGSVGGAMSVCTQPRCGTHTPPWAGCWVFNHQIHSSTRLSETCAPGVTSAWSCPTKISVVAACGRGTTAKSLMPVRDVTEVFPEGCHQFSRGCGSVDAVERSQFRVVEGTRAPLLRWPRGSGGMVSRSWSSVVLVGEECCEVVPGFPPGKYSMEGSRCSGTEQVVAAGSGSADS